MEFARCWGMMLPGFVVNQGFFMQKIKYSYYRGVQVIAIFGQIYCKIPLVITCDSCCYSDRRVMSNYSGCLLGAPNG